MSTLILTNPSGMRTRRNLPRLQAFLGAMPEVEHCVTNQLGELDALIKTRQWQSDDLVIINGGDGSVQHFLTRLLARRPHTAWPRLAILPGGTTNMTAFAFNQSRSWRNSLATLTGALQSGQIQCKSHRLLQVNNGQEQQVGTFFGAAAVVAGIEYFHQRLGQRGTRSQWGVGLVVLKAAWAMARRQAPFAQPTRIRLDDSEDYATLILLVTSLEQLILGIRPFWGQHDGPLNLTLIEQRAAHILRNMPRLLRGKPGRALCPQNGYHSRKLKQIRLSLDGPFTIDGEIFDCHGPSIELTATGPIEVLPL